MRAWYAAIIAAFVCFLSLFPLLSFADVASQQAALQAQLDQINQQIAVSQKQLASLQTQRATYESAVAIVDSQIKQAQLQIQARNLYIQQIKDKITATVAGISQLDASVAAGQQSLAQILRETNIYDNTPLVVLALNGTLSQVFTELGDFQSIQKALGNSFTQMAAQRSDLTARQQALEQEQQDQSDLLSAQEAQQNSLKSLEAQKQKLVTETKGKESLYQQLISTQKKTAAEIKTQLFALRDAQSVSFGTMYSYAKEASAYTGVEPAFILAILREESNLGQNVGSCTYDQAMNPKRDVPIFLTLMQQLGLDPSQMKVSCKPWYGWGGAMGPAQFIPSTWQLYQARIAKATGQNPPNPYDARTATFATAIYMSDLGADAGTATAERRAALRYFAGGHWSNPAYAFYGDDVMGFTAEYQKDIQVLGS